MSEVPLHPLNPNLTPQHGQHALTPTEGWPFWGYNPV